MASEYTAAIGTKDLARARDFLLSWEADGPGPDDEQTASRRRAASYMARFGREGMSFLSLKSESSYWFGAGGCVAYVDTGASWVAAGAPLCAPGDTEAVAAAFVKAAMTTGRRATFFAAEQTFGDEPSLDAICIGQQPTWNPQRWPSTLSSSRSLREQLRRAKAKGVRVRRLEAAEVLDPNSPTRVAVERIVKAWLDTKGLETMGFLVHPAPFALPEARRYFVAKREGTIVACLIASPVPARRGWLVDMTARTKAAPNGTTELLVDALMRGIDGGLRVGVVGTGSAVRPGPRLDEEDWLAHTVVVRLRGPAGVQGEAASAGMGADVSRSSQAHAGNDRADGCVDRVCQRKPAAIRPADSAAPPREGRLDGRSDCGRGERGNRDCHVRGLDPAPIRESARGRFDEHHAQPRATPARL